MTSQTQSHGPQANLTAYESGWKPDGWLGARKKVTITLENGHLEVKTIAQSAIAHLFQRIENFFNGELKDDFWNSSKTKATDLDKEQALALKNIITNLQYTVKNTPDAEILKKAKKTIKNTISGLNAIQEANISPEITTKTKDTIKALKQKIEELEHQASQRESAPQTPLLSNTVTASPVSPQKTEEVSAQALEHERTKHKLTQSEEQLSNVQKALAEQQAKVEALQTQLLKAELDNLKEQLHALDKEDAKLEEDALTNQEKTLAQQKKLVDSLKELNELKAELEKVNAEDKQFEDKQFEDLFAEEQKLAEKQKLQKELSKIEEEIFLLNQEISIRDELKSKILDSKETIDFLEAEEALLKEQLAQLVKKQVKEEIAVPKTLSLSSSPISSSPIDTEKAVEQLKKTLLRTKEAAETTLQQAALEEQEARKRLANPEHFLKKIHKTQQAVAEILKQTNTELNDPAQNTTETHLQEAQAICSEAEEWVKNIQKTHEALLIAQKLESQLKETKAAVNELQALIPGFANWEKYFSPIESRVDQSVTLEEAKEANDAFKRNLQLLQRELQSTSIDFLSAQRNKALLALTDPSIKSTRKKAWEQLEENRPRIGDWKTLYTWYSEVGKAAAVDSELTALIKDHPGVSSGKLVTLTAEKIIEFGLSIPSSIQIPELSEQLAEIKQAFEALKEDKNLTFNNLEKASHKLSSFTDTVLNTYNLPSEKEAQLLQNRKHLQALNSVVKILIDSHKSPDSFKNEKEIQEELENINPDLSSYYALVLPSLYSSESWDIQHPLSGLLTKEGLLDGVKTQRNEAIAQLKTLAQTHKRATEEVKKAPKTSQTATEEKDLRQLITTLTDETKKAALSLSDKSTLIKKTSANLDSFIKKVAYRSTIHPSVINEIDAALKEIQEQRELVFEISDLVNDSLDDTAKFEDAEKALNELKTNWDISTSRTWRIWPNFLRKSSTASESHTLTIEALSEKKDQALEKIKSIKQTASLGKLYKYHQQIKELKSSIKEQIKVLYEKGQIDHADLFSLQFEAKLKEFESKIKSFPVVPYIPQLIYSNEFIPLFNQCKNDLAELSKKTLNASSLSLRTQIDKADTTEKQTLLIAAWNKEMQSEPDSIIAKAKKDTQSINSAILKLDIKDEELQNYLNNKLKNTLEPSLKILNELKTTSPEALTFADISKQAKDLDKAIADLDKGFASLKEEIKKIYKAEKAYAEAMEAIKTKASSLDKANQLIAHAQLKKAIKISTKTKGQGPAPSWFSRWIGTSKKDPVARYTQSLGNHVGQLKRSQKEVSKMKQYDPYIDQLNVKNLPPKLAGEIRRRFMESTENTLEQGIVSLNKYKGFVEHIAPYLKSSTNLWGTSSSLSKESLTSLIDSKVALLKKFKSEFKQEGYIYTSPKAVNDKLTVRELKEYETQIKKAKKDVLAFMDDESHLATTSKALTTWETAKKTAADYIKTLREKNEHTRANKLGFTQNDFKEKNFEALTDLTKFCKEIEEQTHSINTEIAKDRLLVSQPILKQMEAAAKALKNKAKGAISDQVTALKELFIQETAELIGKHSKKMNGFSEKLKTWASLGYMSQAFAKKVQKDIQGHMGKIHSTYGTNKTQTVTRRGFLGRMYNTEEHLVDMTHTELETYNTNLKTALRSADFNNIETLDKKITEYEEISKLLRSVADDVESAYENKTDKENLEKKVKAFEHVNKVVFKNFCTNISSSEGMKLAESTLKEQIDHMKLFIVNLRRQLQENRKASHTFAKPTVVALEVPSFITMNLEEQTSGYKTKAEYLNARWELLTGIKTPAGTNVTTTIAAAAIPAPGAPVPAPVQFPARTVPPAPTDPVKGSPHYNAWKFADNLDGYNTELTRLAAAPGITAANRAHLTKLINFVQSKRDLFQRFYDGVVEYDSKNNQYKHVQPLAKMDSLVEMMAYIKIMQDECLRYGEYLQEEIGKIPGKPIFPNIYDDIEWKLP